jgi:hypothetical protein
VRRGAGAVTYFVSHGSELVRIAFKGDRFGWIGRCGTRFRAVTGI